MNSLGEERWRVCWLCWVCCFSAAVTRELEQQHFNAFFRAFVNISCLNVSNSFSSLEEEEEKRDVEVLEEERSTPDPTKTWPELVGKVNENNSKSFVDISFLFIW